MKFPWQKNDATGVQELELPDELVEGMKAGKDAKEGLSRIEQMLKDQASLQAKKDKEEKDRADAAAAAARKREQEAATGTLEEQIEALMLEGRTKDAIELATKSKTDALASVVMTTRADQIKRETFENEEKFKYYHGDIKTEVDSLLARQPLEFRQNPENIENCYNTVVGKHHSEIMEGKIKTRFAGASGSRDGGRAGESGTKDDKPPVITDDLRKAARLLGFKPEEYAKMLDDEGVGYA